MSTQITKVLLKGKLRLSAEREQLLLEHAMRRRAGIREEMGFASMQAASGLGIQRQSSGLRGASFSGWAQLRYEHHLQYENSFEFRRFPGNAKRFSTIFQHFNESVNVPRRAIGVYKARACEALVNTFPFLGMMPEGPDDAGSPIKLAERVYNNSLEDSDARFQFREGITQACLSEAVMKVTLAPAGGDPETVADASVYLNADGTPKRDQRGGYVYTDEELDNDPDVLGQKVLKRDPTVVFDGTEQESAPQPAVRNTPVTNKLSVAPVGWENFYCSILEPDIHTADCIFHEFDEDFDMLMKRTRGIRLSQPAKEWLDNIKTSSQHYPQSEGMQPQPQRGEREVQLHGPIKVHLCEMWMRFDVMDRGQADEICVLWAVGAAGNEMWPIYYDLMTDASPTKKRPFEVVRVIPVKDRWYGFGFYDLLSNEHGFIDDCWSRIRGRSSSAGRLDLIRRDAIEGLEYGQPASLSTGRVYVIKSGQPPGPITNFAGSIQFPELDANLWEMLKMALQNAKIASGTMLPGDASQAELEADDTATAQNLLANESELMSNDTTQDVIRGIIATLKQGAVAVFSEPDVEAINTLLGANDAKKFFEWLKTAKPRDFSKHIKLLLTKARSKQAGEAAMRAIALIVGNVPWIQVCQTMPEVAKALQPLFVDVLNSLDISNADQMLKQTLQACIQIIAQQQAMAAAATAMPAQPGSKPQPQPQFAKAA